MLLKIAYITNYFHWQQKSDRYCNWQQMSPLTLLSKHCSVSFFLYWRLLHCNFLVQDKVQRTATLAYFRPHAKLLSTLTKNLRPGFIGYLIPRTTCHRQVLRSLVTFSQLLWLMLQLFVSLASFFKSQSWAPCTCGSNGQVTIQQVFYRQISAKHLKCPSQQSCRLLSREN